ncbi:hypothetical protein [Flavobacterium sp.]|uniref:hypothetical protein n=1 Tax=Flavobacterium sp. TaxID=239 RepID=UPI003D6A9782
MNKFFLISTVILLFSCSSKILPLETTKNKIEVVKFMHTANHFAKELNEDSFWRNKEGHAKMEILTDGNPTFIDEIKEMKKVELEGLDMLTYSFLVKNGKTTDTIYADSDLKVWEFVKNRKRTYFSDDEKKVSEYLKNQYSFFNNCW